ncbi:hypothetical protein ACHAWF_012599 [Thalassiosira exigua]
MMSPTQSDPYNGKNATPPSGKGGAAMRSPFSSPNVSSSPRRNALSSHASDMGRRLAQERSKNQQLTQRIIELERTVSILQRRKCNNDVGAHQQGNGFSSSPASTPTQGGTVNQFEKSNNFNSDIHLDAPESSHVRMEINDRPDGSKGSPPIFQQPILNDGNDTTSEMNSGPSISSLICQASRLLSGNHSDDIDGAIHTASHSSMSDGENMGSTKIREQMKEYQELVTDFHSEQQSHGDIDGEELIPREDISWLFQELKWRFDEIYIGYAGNRFNEKSESHCIPQEWKDCLEGLLDVAKNIARQKPPTTRRGPNWQSVDGPINSSLVDSNSLRNEVEMLNERLASFAVHHNETCRSLCDDMEAMKRNYQEQIANKSQQIQNLESKIIEQEEYIAQIQKETQKDRQWIGEEKHKLALTKEGTMARIRYLEGMLRSLQIELKDARTPQKIAASGEDTDQVQRGISSPVFMRNLTAAMNGVGSTTLEDFMANSATFSEKPIGETKEIFAHLEVKKLIDQIASLGSSLAESETSRATLLEDFQEERRKYIMQYKQMSDILKQLIADEKMIVNS